MKSITAIVILVALFSVSFADEITPSAAKRFATVDTQETPDFQKHVVPLLGRLGCNAAKCHGSFQGQGGLQLSLFGFDFQADQAALTGEAESEEGNRVNPLKPHESLILLKPTEQTDHEGGKRFEKDSWEYQVLMRWIESGTKGAKGAKEIQATIPPAASSSNQFTAKGIEFFDENIRPLLENNCFECHAGNNRKGNLQLDARARSLAGGESGAAIVAGEPEKSLLIQAVRFNSEDLQMPPSGKLAPQEIADLEAWVKMGAPWPDRYDANAAGDTDQVLAKLHYEPVEVLFEDPGDTTVLKIVAEWENGVREDVTCLTRFQTNNDAIVTVDRDGLAMSVGEGDTHIVAFYDNGVAAIPVLRPVSPKTSQKLRDVRASNSDHPIDRLVNAKLAKLGLVSSAVCTDSEFLRRLSIDLTGTLPTPDEVIAFLADPSNDKRRRKIDELLERPAYAAWWTNKLCDFTGCNPKSISSLLEVAREDGYVKASEWYDWIYERVARNESYANIVEGIMLADLSGRGDGMPYFWTRQSLEEPKDTAMSVAHAFLGIQMQCAECHKHPFDKWTQADFNDFSRFFDSVTTTKRTSSVTEPQQLSLLRSQRVPLEPGDDPRKPIMDWMRDSTNPWFAKAFVNRVWAGYFHAGIVDPPDQFTPANPPSNAPLLDWLASGFIENDYDMKWLHRQITSSETYQRGWQPNETNRNDRRNFSRAIPRRIPAEVVYDAMKQVTAATDQQDAVRTNLQRRASGHLSMRMAGTHAMKVFGKPDRSINCDCERVNEPTLLQAIFTQNDPIVRMRIADSGWIIELEDAEAASEPLDRVDLINQVWLRTVGRGPGEEEQRRAKEHLASASSVAEGIADLMWAMLNTKEFLLNH